MPPISLPRNGIIFDADSFFAADDAVSGDCAAAKHTVHKLARD